MSNSKTIELLQADLANYARHRDELFADAKKHEVARQTCIDNANTAHGAFVATNNFILKLQSLDAGAEEPKAAENTEATNPAAGSPVVPATPPTTEAVTSALDRVRAKRAEKQASATPTAPAEKKPKSRKGDKKAKA